jgi:hypothetical protein
VGLRFFSVGDVDGTVVADGDVAVDVVVVVEGV